MEKQHAHPCLPAFIEEIRGNPSYLRFLRLLKSYGIDALYDCHAHISSGPSDVIEDTPDALVPRYPFTVTDNMLLYDRLFGREGIACASVVFDTPLPAYDLARKNDELIAYWRSLDTPDRERIMPFAVITPEMELHEIQQWVERGMKGFKMTPRTASAHVKRGVISDITLTEMLSPEALWVADREGLPLVVHLPQLVVNPRIKPGLKDELLRIAARFSDLKIILAHVGQAQTPAKMTDLLNLIEGNGLTGMIWMDISAVTIPSVMAMAFESNVKLLYGTDIDFALVERGRYVMFKVDNGRRTLANDDAAGNVITALVSQNFGQKLKPFVLEAGIPLDAPLMVFQWEGILDAVDRLTAKGLPAERIKSILENLFHHNAGALFR